MASTLEEIGITDQAPVSAVARALGIPAGSKSLTLLLAEINQLDESVHSALISYLAAHHLCIRRQAFLEQASGQAVADVRAKLRVAEGVRDQRIRPLREAIGRFRAAQVPPVDPFPWHPNLMSSRAEHRTEPELQDATRLVERHVDEASQVRAVAEAVDSASDD